MTESTRELIVTPKKLLHIGKWLKELRGDIPQIIVAKAMKTDQPNISSMEGGVNRKNPSFKNFYTYLKSVGYNIIVKKDDNRIIVKDATLKKFGTFLRSLRGDTPQETIVSRMNVNISMLESEKNPKNPSITTLVNYLKAIGYILVIEKKENGIVFPL